MKKYIFKGLLYLCVPAAILGSCKKLDVTAGVEQIVDGSFSKASASFQFMDAKTGMQLDLQGNEKIQISIAGKNATDVVDNVGSSNLEASAGILATGLKEGVVPSTSNPIEFTIHATANGYLPVSKSVVLFQEGHKHVYVYMVNVNDAPAGISVKEGTVSGVPSSGVTASAFSLLPNVTTGSGTTASVTIPAGTKLMDKNNAAVSGTVTATLAYFDPAGENTSMQLPDMQRAKTTTGEYVSFNTLGAISMEMVNGNGKEVKNFGSAIQMTISIPDGSTKFDGTAVAAGDTYGIYSYNDETAEWKLESNEVVSMNSTSGKLEVTFDMIHLSTWQVAEKIVTNGKYYFNSVTFKGSCPDYFNNATNIIVEILYYPATNRYEKKEIAKINLNQPVSIVGVHQSNVSWATNRKYKWYKKDNPSDFILASADYNSHPTVQLPASWCEPVPPTSFNINLTTFCPSNPNRKIQPQCFVMACEEGEFFNFENKPWIVVGQMTNGLLSTNTSVLEKGKKYTLFTIFKGKMVFLTGSAQFNSAGVVTGADFGSRLVDGNDIDLSRGLSTDECTYLTKIVG